MADLPVQPMVNYGDMLMSVPSAQSTIDTQTAQQGLARAQTQRVGVDTETARLQNQRTALQLGFMQQFIQKMNQPALNDSTHGLGDIPQDDSGVSPQTPPTGRLSPEDAIDSDHIADHMQQKYAVRDIWTPQEMEQRQAAAVSGLPGATDMIDAAHKQRIGNAQAQAQLAASKGYDEAVLVSTAPEGAALQTLARVYGQDSPQVKHVKQISEENHWSPDETDQYVRQFADTAGNALHRYSGREVEVGKDGVARDKETTQPLLNGNPVGLSAQEYSDLKTKWNEPKVVAEGQHTRTVPLWRYAGFSSLAAAINADGLRQRMSTQQPTAGAPAGAAPGAAPAAAGGTVAPIAGAPTTGAPGPASQAATTNPQLRTALADSDYRLPKTASQFGVSAEPGDVEESKAIKTSKTNMLETTGFNAKVSGAALTYLNAAQSVLDAGGVTTGIGANAITDINRLARQVGLKTGLTADPSKNIELVKNLVNAGLQNIKATFGPRVTANEVFLNLNKANPSAEMPEEALRSLIKENTDIAKYDVSTAQRAKTYLAAGNDPRKFDEWAQTYFPKEKAVQITQPTGGAKQMPNDAKLQAYADKHKEFGGDIQKARAFLLKNGYR